MSQKEGVGVVGEVHASDSKMARRPEGREGGFRDLRTEAAPSSKFSSLPSGVVRRIPLSTSFLNSFF